MAQAASEGAVFTYKVTADTRGNYLQMFKPQTTKMIKSLQIPQEQLPEVRAGEAWIETNGNEVLCCIPLEGNLIAGHVVGVSQKGIKVKTKTVQVATFPMQWGPAMSQVKLYDSVRVNVKGQKLYVIPGDGNPPRLLQVPQHHLNPQASASVPDVFQSIQSVHRHDPQPSTFSLPQTSASLTRPAANNVPFMPPPSQAPEQRESKVDITEAMKADFHRPSEEDFQQRTPEFAKTIGRHRLPIEILQEEFKWNRVMVQKFQMLSQPYSVCRRIRGDGNCFYRCLGALLLEHYCRPDTSLQEFYTVYSEIIHQNRHFVLSLANEQDIGMFKQFIKLLKDLYTLRSKGENAFQHLQYCLQRQNIDKAMIVAMRKYTASYLQQNYQHPDIAPFLENADALLNEIIEYKREAEGVAFLLAARCFSVVLHILTVNNTSSDVVETVYGPETQGWYPSFSVLHLPGHYNCLIRREVHETDHYNFASNTYTPTPTGQIVGYELFPQ